MRFADNFMPAHQINEMKITQEQIRDISARPTDGIIICYKQRNLCNTVYS